MIVAGSASPLLLSSAGGYNLTKSLRFRASASAYLSRTNTNSPTNNKICTWSFWFKNSQQSANAWITGTGTAGTSTTEDSLVIISSTQTLYCELSGAANGSFQTTQVFRDPSAWYHIVVAYDTTQATNTNRIKLYVNGVQVTAFSSISYPALNATLNFGGTQPQSIGRRQFAASNYLDGYLTEVNFIDGQALTPSSFGQTSPTTGVWQPIKYTGTYGTNGFYLPFTDVATTSGSNAGLGKDFSGNGNYWTTNNISVTSGSTYDSMNDVPTLTNATTANYCVLNPLSNGAGTLSNANLQLGGIGGAGLGRCNGTVAVSSGKWYFESTLTTASSYTNIGIGQGDITNQYPGQDAVSYAFTCEQAIKINNNSQPSYGVSLTTGDVLMVAFDLDNNKIFFGKNGTWMASSDPVTGANPAFTIAAGTYKPIARPYDSSGVINVNFGQRPFAYTPPTGFVALNTFNLSTPTIGATASTVANKYMDVSLYTGNGSTQSITNSNSMQPDLVWIKPRAASVSHSLYDSVRGAFIALASDTTNGDTNYNPYGVTSFNSNGFSLNDIANGGYRVNGSPGGAFSGASAAYVAWQWRASNATGVTNTAGSITSTVSANTTAGFSIVTYTGTGANATVGHGLGVAPRMIIVKNRGVTDVWMVQHASLGPTKYIILNRTDTEGTLSTVWNNTAPTSSVFSIGTLVDVNRSSNNYVAYCFAQVAGYSAFGTWQNNNSTDGTFVYLGFRPRFIMLKNTDNVERWFIQDSARQPYNYGPATSNYLVPNSSATEGTNGADTACIDFLSNGFKIRTTNPASGEISFGTRTYIYACFAESPFKYANAR